MAIVGLVPMMGPGDRVADADVGSGKSYVQRFRVETNNQNTGQASLLAQLGYYYGQKYLIGYPGGGLDADFYAYLTNIHIESDSEDGLWWVATFTYSWYDANTLGGGPDQNPLLMPIEVNWGWRDNELVVDRDIEGAVVKNTAGDPYDPPVKIVDPRMTMTVIRNEASISLGLIQQYRNAINSDTFGAWDPYFAHCLGITPKNTFHQQVGWYYQVTYEFEFITPRQAAQVSVGGESQGFRMLVVNQGVRAISETDGKVYHITLRGVPVSQPMLLKANGEKLGLNGDPVFNLIKAYPELPFTQAFNFDPLAITGQRSGFNSPGGMGGGA